MSNVSAVRPTHKMHVTATDPLYASGPLVADRVGPSFDDRPYERFSVAPMTPTIGAEVDGIRLGGDLDEETMAELRRALLEWKVLVFRDQDIERSAHRAFASKWGELEEHPFIKYGKYPGQTDADVVTLERDVSVAGIENNWHHDVSWSRAPSFGAVLRAVEVPAVGGDTLFADTCAAYDLLPDAIKERIDSLVAEHDWVPNFGKSMTPDVIAALRPDYPAAQHPVVRVIPETGRRTLFVNTNFTQRILGVSEAESNELLTLLYRHVQRAEFQVRLRWRKDTVAFWDNRTCQHYAASDYYPQRRIMDRLSIVGDVPVGIAGSPVAQEA
ncbi:TauD/TfdA dioxygenase family protein [Tomitella biformata]|uniref:TauD/TfdA dioxygenase family protein n=1 Tax=Tomitella biformata TaxID=630403 RepID=UPI000467B4CB|nr:TauD/TfdA family dioxygenase [Tomitella biformata]